MGKGNTLNGRLDDVTVAAGGGSQQRSAYEYQDDSQQGSAYEYMLDQAPPALPTKGNGNGNGSGPTPPARPRNNNNNTSASNTYLAPAGGEGEGEGEGAYVEPNRRRQSHGQASTSTVPSNTKHPTPNKQHSTPPSFLGRQQWGVRAFSRVLKGCQ